MNTVTTYHDFDGDNGNAAITDRTAVWAALQANGAGQQNMLVYMQPCSDGSYQPVTINYTGPGNLNINPSDITSMDNDGAWFLDATTGNGGVEGYLVEVAKPAPVTCSNAVKRGAHAAPARVRGVVRMHMTRLGVVH